MGKSNASQYANFGSLPNFVVFTESPFLFVSPVHISITGEI